MASLTLTIGALTASVSADNTKASNLLNAYADAIGATGTNQQKADAVIASLARHMRELAHMRRKNEATVQTLAGIANELSALSWEP
jgi:hypothetical protein